MLKNFKIKYRNQGGMTLIELLVVLSIFIIVAGLTIFDYGRFRSNASLQNLADDVALSVRRAQGFAIGVVGQGSIFSNGYGIHFSTAAPTGNTAAGSNKSFIIYYDLNGNKIYDYPLGRGASCTETAANGSGGECYDLLTITTNDIIKGICPGGGDPSAIDTDANCASATNADITFVRPDSKAYIYINGQPAAGSVDIEIQNTTTQDTKFISISPLGQISIK